MTRFGLPANALVATSVRQRNVKANTALRTTFGRTTVFETLRFVFINSPGHRTIRSGEGQSPGLTLRSAKSSRTPRTEEVDELRNRGFRGLARRVRINMRERNQKR